MIDISLLSTPYHGKSRRASCAGALAVHSCFALGIGCGGGVGEAYKNGSVMVCLKIGYTGTHQTRLSNGENYGRINTWGTLYFFKAKPICLKILRGLHIQSLELSGQLCGMFDPHFQATPHLDSGLEKVEFPDKTRRSCGVLESARY